MNRQEQLRSEISRAAQIAPTISINDTATHTKSGTMPAFITQGEVALRGQSEIYEFFSLAEQLGIGTVPLEDQYKTAVHEGQHGAAAEHIRVVQAGFVGRILKVVLNSGQLSFGIQIAHKAEYDLRRHGALHIASVMAHPRWLPATDVDGLADMGYDLERVGYEAERYNTQWGGYYIPIPMSYQPRTVLPVNQTHIQPLRLRPL